MMQLCIQSISLGCCSTTTGGGGGGCSPAEFRVDEGSSYVVQADLVDESGDPVESADLDSVTLTITEQSTGSLVNGRDHQEVLGSNGGTLTGGTFSFSITPPDTAIINGTPPGDRERHLLTFTARWGGGAGQRTWRVLLSVRSLSSVS